MAVLVGSQLFAWLGFGVFVAYQGALVITDTINHVRWQLEGGHDDSRDAGDPLEAAESTPRGA